jgi:hypothetical protein
VVRCVRRKWRDRMMIGPLEGVSPIIEESSELDALLPSRIMAKGSVR